MKDLERETTDVRDAGEPEESWRRSLAATNLRSTSREAGQQLVTTVTNEVASAERHPLELLAFVATTIAGLEDLIEQLVVECRQQYGKRHWTRGGERTMYLGRVRWDDIGRALGITGEGARKRYRDAARDGAEA